MVGGGGGVQAPKPDLTQQYPISLAFGVERMAGQEWIRVEIGQIGVTWSSDRGQHARCHIAGKLCLAWVPPEAWM